jgi:hypothetical protein
MDELEAQIQYNSAILKLACKSILYVDFDPVFGLDV